jgi:hypothetical protein
MGKRKRHPRSKPKSGAVAPKPASRNQKISKDVIPKSLQKPDLTLAFAQKLPGQVADEFARIYGCFGALQTAMLIRDDIATAKERSLIEKSDWSRAAIVQILCQSRGCSIGRCIADVGLELGLVSSLTHKRLRSSIDEPIDTFYQSRPVWDKAVGNLYFEGELARHVSPTAKNVRLILDAFSEQQWPIHVASPLPGGPNSRRLRNTVRSLNTGLSGIRFYCDGTAEGIQWEPTRTRAARA